MNKKTLFILLPALLLLNGCEAGEKIAAFWLKQYQKLMSSSMGAGLEMAAAQRKAQAQAKMTRAGLTNEKGEPLSNADFERQLAKAREELKQLEASLKKEQGYQPNTPLSPEEAAAAFAQQQQENTAARTPGARTAQTATPKRAPRQQQQQIMEISIEDDTPKLDGRAPVEDQKAMHRSIDFIKTTNQQAVTDVQRLMGDNARYEVILLNTQTEKKLLNASRKAASLQEFKKTQKEILAQYKTDFQKILNKYQNNIKRTRR